MKDVVLESLIIKRLTTCKEYDILLCKDNVGFFINAVSKSPIGVKTMASNIPTLAEAKEKFLSIVWELS